MLPAVDHVDLPVLGRSGGWDLPVNQVKSMNEIDTDTLEGKIAVMTAFKEGVDIEYRIPSGDNIWRHTIGPDWDWKTCVYRIKPLEFPKLPEGKSYHNPGNLTPGQVGEGWRLLLSTEVNDNPDLCIGAKTNTVEAWCSCGWDRNCGAGYVGCDLSRTYRLPASTPFPETPKHKVMVPLEPHDISPTDVLRQKDRQYPYHEHWMKIDAVNCDGPAIHFPGMGRIRLPFKDLASHWEISRDGAKTWKPCEKESAS